MKTEDKIPQTSEDWYKSAQFLVPQKQPSIFELVERCAKSMIEQKDKEIKNAN